MRAGADKIIIKRNTNGHYVYFSCRVDDDNGTIIDFLQYRQRLSLGAVRKALRPWIGRPASPALPCRCSPPSRPPARTALPSKPTNYGCPSPRRAPIWKPAAAGRAARLTALCRPHPDRCPLERRLPALRRGGPLRLRTQEPGVHGVCRRRAQRTLAQPGIGLVTSEPVQRGRHARVRPHARSWLSRPFHKFTHVL